MFFKDRIDAGKKVAGKLDHLRGAKGLIVLALPRGGVVNGFEVARHLDCPLDVILVRKIGFPGQPELAIGAVAETGAVVLNREIIDMGGISETYIEEAVQAQKLEIERRLQLYRGGAGIPPLEGQTVVLVDDGVATGATMKAAISALKEEKLDRLVVALPVSSVEAEREIGPTVDEWVCLHTPEDFMAIGAFYDDFTQVTDDEVVEMLKDSKRPEG